MNIVYGQQFNLPIFMILLLLFNSANAGVLYENCSYLKKELNVSYARLDQNCNIGRGIWDGKIPDIKGSIFWVQIYALNNTETYNKFSYPFDSYIYNSDGLSKVLVGPYYSKKQAIYNLNIIKKLTDIKDVFLREVNILTKESDEKEPELKGNDFSNLVIVPDHKHRDKKINFDIGYNVGIDKKHIGRHPSGSLFGIYFKEKIDNDMSLKIGFQHHEQLESNDGTARVEYNSIFSTLEFNYAIDYKNSLFLGVGASFWDIEKDCIYFELHDQGLSPLVEFGYSRKIAEQLDSYLSIQYIYSIGHESSTGEYDSLSLKAGLAF
ncbi:outer membrane protein A precursor [Vibrio ponticus]|nr:outer membrane protein A precursor [Vibrio ponticus]